MKRRIPIAKKLLVMVLVTSAAMSTLMTVAQILFEYKEKRYQQTEVIAGLETGLLPSVAQKLWDYDLSPLPEQFRGIIRNLDVSHIKLELSDGKVVFDEGVPGFVAKFPVIVSMPVVFDDQGNRVAVGKITIEFYSDKIVEEIKFHFVTLLLFNMFKTFIVSLVLIQMFKRTITRPLLEIVGYFEKAGAGNPDDAGDLRVARGGPDDEITDLISYISDHERSLRDLQRAQRDRIASQEKALEESDEKIKEERARAEMSSRMAHMAEMASGIAHEINNPLAIIQGYFSVSKLEAKKPKPDMNTIVDYLVKGEKTVSRAAKIVSALRDFARDPSNDEAVVVPVQAILDELPTLIGVKVKTAGVDLTVANHLPESMAIDGRKTAIDQALYSLVNNSLDAVKSAQGAWIRVEAMQRGQRVEISVIDSGKGIDPAVADKMFQPFFTTKEVGQGAGLGLSMAQGIIKNHGGELIYDKSSPNTCYKIYLPMSVKAKKSA